MSQTMTARILARASGDAAVNVGEVVLAKIELFTQLDGTTFIDEFVARELKVWDPKRIIFCFDHSFQNDWMPQVAYKEHQKIRKFAKDQGVPAENLYDFGRNGISHHIPIEQGWALPGTVCMGADTQSATLGAANTFSMATAPDAVLLTGDIWMMVPECVRIYLTGQLPKGINGKDVVYRLIKELRGRVSGQVLEFAGPGVKTLPMDVRMAIANGAVQIGAMSAVFPADQVLLDYYKGRTRGPFEPVAAGDEAHYFQEFEYDLSSIDYLIAGPSDIGRIRPLSELAGQEVTAANIGSCSSGRLSDLALAADVLRGHKVHPSVRLIVTPISADTMKAAMSSGIIQDLIDAGATITQPGCGACYSGNLSPLKLGDEERCISTSVETNQGRMGSQTAEILLGNAAVVAASAIEGRIANPSQYLRAG